MLYGTVYLAVLMELVQTATKLSVVFRLKYIKIGFLAHSEDSKGHSTGSAT